MQPQHDRKPPQIQTSTSATDDARVRLVRFSCVAVLVLLWLGIWAFLPALIIEHRRIEHWKLLGLWAGDAVALLWFLRFAFVHALLGEPLTHKPDAIGRRQFTRFAVAIALALLSDLGFTLYIMHGEREAYHRGRVVEAQVLSMHTHLRAKATWYSMDAEFRDLTGARHVAHVRVHAENHILPEDLPPETARALSTQPPGLRSFQIRYDPVFPARAWVDGTGWDDGNRLYWFSLLTLFFQAITTALFLLMIHTHSRAGYWPWWRDTYKAIPLIAQAFWMFATGTIDRLLG
jgi:hypothetical protein